MAVTDLPLAEEFLPDCSPGSSGATQRSAELEVIAAL
jgi:hypothetical protein